MVGREVACGQADRCDDSDSRPAQFWVCANTMAARHIAGIRQLALRL